MSDNDQLFELFRRNEHKLSEKPSRRAWERLDAKLDRHYSKNRRPSWLRYGGMVAAVLILVFAATLLMMHSESMSNDQFAMNADSGSAILMDLDGDVDDNYMKIVAYQNEYKNRSSRITEKIMVGNLQPRNGQGYFTNKARDYSDSEPADDDKVIAALEEEVDEVEEYKSYDEENNIEIEDDTYIDTEVSEVTSNMTRVEKPTIVEVIPEASPIMEEVASVDKSYEDAEVAEEVYVESITTYPTTSSAPAAPAPVAISPAKGNADYDAGMSMKEEAKPKKKNKNKSESAPSVRYDVNMDDEGYPGMKDEMEDAPTGGLSDFNWILGDWKGKINGSVSTENWTKLDDNTYVGKGNVSTSGVNLFSEKMELRESSGTVYLWVTLDKNGKKTSYKMISNSGSIAVFENRKMSYPKRILLKRSSNNIFSFIMQNGDTRSLNDSQVRYLENRNNIVGEKLMRSLKKVND